MKGYYQAIKLGPDKKPSNGTVIHTGTREEVDALWIPGEVITAWAYDAPEVRKLSAKSLGSRRRKRMENRLKKKFPLFADELMETELKTRTEHYYPKEQNQ